MRAGVGYRLLGQHRADQMVFRTLCLSLTQGQMVDRPARGGRCGRDADDDEHQYDEPQHGLDPIGGTAQRVPVEPQPADAPRPPVAHHGRPSRDVRMPHTRHPAGQLVVAAGKACVQIHDPGSHRLGLAIGENEHACDDQDGPAEERGPQ